MLKFFRGTVVNADIQSQKSLHILFDKYFDHMLVKFKQNRSVWEIQIFKTVFNQKKKVQVYENRLWLSVDAILKEGSVAETICEC